MQNIVENNTRSNQKYFKYKTILQLSSLLIDVNLELGCDLEIEIEIHYKRVFILKPIDSKKWSQKCIMLTHIVKDLSSINFNLASASSAVTEIRSGSTNLLSGLTCRITNRNISFAEPRDRFRQKQVGEQC